MIINLFLKNKLKSEHINSYQTAASLLISLHSLYAIKYCKNLEPTGIIIATHLLIDLIFTDPVFFLHHTCGISLMFFIYNNNIIKEHIELLCRRFITIEISSIFLSLRFYIYKLKKCIIARPYSTQNKHLILIIRCIETINNIAFVSSFFKFRVYDYFFNILIDHEVNKLLYHYTQYKLLTHLQIYSTIYILYGINLYWFTKIIKMMLRQKKNCN
jgi:hypothetical protein